MVGCHHGNFKNQNLLRNFGLNTKNHNYVIAEIGINHGSLEKAEMLIESASRTGCDAVKFQTYITEKELRRIIKFIIF